MYYINISIFIRIYMYASHTTFAIAPKMRQSSPPSTFTAAKFMQLKEELYKEHGGNLATIQQIVRASDTLSDGVEISCSSKGNSVLHIAIYCNSDVRIVQYLAETYPETLRTVNDQDHDIPLHFALRHRDRRYIKGRRFATTARNAVAARHQLTLTMLCLAKDMQHAGRDPRHRTSPEDRVTPFSHFELDIMTKILEHVHNVEMSEDDYFSNLDKVLDFLAHATTMCVVPYAYSNFMIFMALRVHAAPFVIKCIIELNRGALSIGHKYGHVQGMPLHYALRLMTADSTKNLAILHHLLDAAPDIISFTLYSCRSPLNIATGHGTNIAIVNLLVERADDIVNNVDENGMTIFHDIFLSYSYNIVHTGVLLRKASYYTMCRVEKWGLTALHLLFEAPYTFERHYAAYGLEFVRLFVTACPTAVAALENGFNSTVVHYIIRQNYQSVGISLEKHLHILEVLKLLVQKYPPVLFMYCQLQRPIDMVQIDLAQDNQPHNRLRAEVAMLLLHCENINSL